MVIHQARIICLILTFYGSNLCYFTFWLNVLKQYSNSSPSNSTSLKISLDTFHVYGSLLVHFQPWLISHWWETNNEITSNTIFYYKFFISTPCISPYKDRKITKPTLILLLIHWASSVGFIPLFYGYKLCYFTFWLNIIKQKLISSSYYSTTLKINQNSLNAYVIWLL